MKKNVELLSPVGGITQFFAAVENGADAVYIGGSKFNARIKADNFSNDELAQAIRYAHVRNVKVYITVNTLIFDYEMASATAYCIDLYNMGADGIIVQDIGLAAWIKSNLPDFPLHLSTQGTVYNLSGVLAAEELGFSRVVLARETSLEEIRNITQNSDMEIELFIHGALCICYSGQCQMSRIIGGANGRSGNRGLCAQPCRLPYKVGLLDKEGLLDGNRKTNIEDDYGRYPLSPKDLCTIDYLGEIIDAGVTSLKIEGRMKSPEYVAIVTRIYRKYIDEYLEKGSYSVSQEDKDSLRQIYSRGEFTTGYLFGNPDKKLMTNDLSKHQGIYIGEITNVLQGRNLIDVNLVSPLSIGDGIEIRNENLTGNIVTYIDQISENTFRLGDIKGPSKKGEAVYRISQASQLKEAHKTYEGASFIDGKNHKSIPIDLELSLRIGDNPILEIREVESDDIFKYVDYDTTVDLAIRRPLEKSLAERQLRKTGNTCFEVRNVVANIEGRSTLPLSSMNKLRREALSAFEEYKIKKMARKEISKKDLPLIYENIYEEKEKTLAFYFFDMKLAEQYDFKAKMDLLNVKKAKIYLPLQDYMNANNRLSFVEGENPDCLDQIPYISNISKGKLDEYIEENFVEIVDSVRKTGIAIGNLGWCREFIAEGVEVYSDYGLNLNNEIAKNAACEFGITPIAMSLENLDESDIPIMITEHPLEFDKLVDRKNQPYSILRTASGDKWMIFRASGEISKERLIKNWDECNGEFRIYIK